jgi:nodulation protein F
MEKSDELSERFRSALVPHLRFVDAGGPLPMEAELRDLGLDSIGTINLLLELESRFGVVFPDALLNEETFRTAATLESAVMGLMRG